ncbi:MAG: PilZ domain-containing protein [Syntrophales bacterium]|nr:PilZ domain-containing protein [Syntrophales bacterium]
MDDRRQFDRFELSVAARIEYKDGYKEIALDVEASDLSAGGFFFRSEHPLPEGLPVKVELILYFDELKTLTDPDGRIMITVTGQIQRSDTDGTAIVFHDDYDVTAPLDFLEVHKIC